jgi:hypothetical protein
MVSIQFSLTSLIKLREIPKHQLDNWNPQWSSVDFLIYDSDIGVPIVGVDFHGKKYHSSSGAQMRDKFKAELFRKINVPYIIFGKDNASEALELFEKIIRKYRDNVYG